MSICKNGNLSLLSSQSSGHTWRAVGHTEGAGLQGGAVTHAGLFALLTLHSASSIASAADDIPQVRHANVAVVDGISPTDTSAQQTGTTVPTGGAAGWHGHVGLRLLAGGALRPIDTHLTLHQTGPVCSQVARHGFVGLVWFISSRFVSSIATISRLVRLVGFVRFVGVVWLVWLITISRLVRFFGFLRFVATSSTPLRFLRLVSTVSTPLGFSSSCR